MGWDRCQHNDVVIVSVASRKSYIALCYTDFTAKLRSVVSNLRESLKIGNEV
jgi:hypothetical protein